VEDKVTFQTPVSAALVVRRARGCAALLTTMRAHEIGVLFEKPSW